MKKTAKKGIFFVCLLIFVLSIPVLFIINIDFISKYSLILFKIENDRILELFLAILSISFSLALVIINFWNDYRKEQKVQTNLEIEKVNNIINFYNCIMLKITTNYNVLINEMDLVIKNLSFLKTNQIFMEIIALWEKNTKIYINYSNDTGFREKIREITKIFTIIYKNNNDFNHYIRFINNWEPIFSKYNTLSIDDREFLFSLRNFISFTKEENNIIVTYSDLINNGNYYVRTCSEFKMAIKNINECFEKEIRTKSINDDKLNELLYHILLKIFHFCEILVLDIFFMERFIDIMRNKVNEYKEKMCKIYKRSLNEIIKPLYTPKNDIIYNYIDEKLIYDYYKINK